MSVRRIIHRDNPFRASEEADKQGRLEGSRNPERTKFFAEREVVNLDGTYPYGEGFLYREDSPRRRTDDWQVGTGTPGKVSSAGHRGSKHEQQDSFAARRFSIRGHEIASLVVADGVSASEDLAKPASSTAIRIFHEHLQKELEELPEHRGERHIFVEQAMTRAAFAANFEVIRQVLFNLDDKGFFTKRDQQKLKRETGVHVPTGPLSLARMQMLAPRLDEAIDALSEQERSALSTFAAAVVVDNDVYTFNCGDAVVGLFRPTETEGKRFLHLTERDQSVVELFQDPDANLDENNDVYENIIDSSFGSTGALEGTLRRYPDLLEPGDRLVVFSDGVGLREDGKGVQRVDIESILDAGGNARDLVKSQVEGLSSPTYQDNTSAVILEVESS